MVLEQHKRRCEALQEWETMTASVAQHSDDAGRTAVHVFSKWTRTMLR